MSAAGVTPLRPPCGHEKVDIHALLADDRLAAAMAAPVVPGTTESDLHLWMVKLYRHIYGSAATVEGACALLRRHPAATEKTVKSACILVKLIWTRSSDTEPCSDAGNARRLAILSGAEITHDPAAGWRIWAGDSWRGDSDGTVVQRWSKRVPGQIAQDANSLYAQAGIAEKREGEEGAAEAEQLNAAARKMKVWSLKSDNATQLAAMARLLRDEPGVLTRSETWDANPRLLACPGATIELTPDGHGTHSPRRADRLTKITRGTPGTGKAAPQWTAFIERALPDSEVRDYVQRLLGYGLRAGNPERLFPFFIGPTSAGKSTASETVRHVLGEYAGTYNLSLFRGKADEGPRQDLVKAMDRRVIFTSEAGERWQLHADEVKRLTGNDSVQARDLYVKKEASVERQPAFMPILCCNHAPIILDADPATWRRLVAVPWEVTTSENEENVNLGEQIREQESDGVLDWLLHGYDMYCELGLKDPPMAVVEATMKLRDNLTIRDQWFIDKTEPREDCSTSTDELWTRFFDDCKRDGIPDKDRGTKIGFSRWLAQRPGLTATKITVAIGDTIENGTKTVRGWQGVYLRPEDADEPDFADHTPG